MKLSNAYLCVQCEEIFDDPQQDACPACTNTGIFLLKKVIPTMEMNKGAFRVALNMPTFEEIKEKIKTMVSR